MKGVSVPTKDTDLIWVKDSLEGDQYFLYPLYDERDAAGSTHHLSLLRKSPDGEQSYIEIAFQENRLGNGSAAIEYYQDDHYTLHYEDPGSRGDRDYDDLCMMTSTWIRAMLTALEMENGAEHVATAMPNLKAVG